MHLGHSTQALADKRKLAALRPSILYLDVESPPRRLSQKKCNIFPRRSFIIEHENEELGCIAMKWCAELFRVFGRPVQLLPSPPPLRHFFVMPCHAGAPRQPERLIRVFVRRVCAAFDGSSAPHLHALSEYSRIIFRCQFTPHNGITVNCRQKQYGKLYRLA